jgi:dihydroxyacetone kinase
VGGGGGDGFKPILFLDNAVCRVTTMAAPQQEITRRGKKLINSVDRCVDDDLEGYVTLNPGVRVLEGHRVVVRADVVELRKSGKVAVVSGGGSGHNPAFAGK